jgi:hypothetical protein
MDNKEIVDKINSYLEDFMKEDLKQLPQDINTALDVLEEQYYTAQRLMLVEHLEKNGWVKKNMWSDPCFRHWC